MKTRKIAAIAGLATLLPIVSVFARAAKQEAPAQSSETPAPAAAFAAAAMAAPPAVRAPANVNAPAAAPAETKTAAPQAQKLSWLDDQGQPNENAKTLVRFLQDAPSHGLNPADYDAAHLARAVKEGVRPQTRGQFSTAMTKAFVDYVQDMTGPRVDPGVTGTPGAYYRTAMTQKQIMAKFAASPNMETMLKDVEPKNPLYTALRGELARLRAAPDAKPAKGAEKLSHAAQIRRVEATMERLRWDKDRPSRYIEVNIPGQHAVAVENGKTVQETNLIVGKADRQTKEITTKITGALFHPPWNIPARIMNKDKIPKLIANPKLFDELGIWAFLNGRRIDPKRLNLRANINNPHLTMQQQPGPKNALGYVRVQMDNRYSQYLHYTSEPELFQKDDRFFSSGCMRMEEPDKMLGFILGLPQDQIDKYKQDPKTVDVKAPQTTAFYSVYHTVSLAKDGTLEFHPDAYRRDEKLIQALSRRGLLPAEAKTAPAAKTTAPAPSQQAAPQKAPEPGP